MGFRTTIIISATSLLLGSTFTHWIADHNTLWRSPVTPTSLSTALNYYSAFVSAPPLVFGTWCLFGAIAVGCLSWKLWERWGAGRGEELFDGGSLFLFLAFGWIHITDIGPNYKLIPNTVPTPLPPTLLSANSPLTYALRDIAASHVLSAVALTGVLFLQGARYYSNNLDQSDVPDESLRQQASSAVSPVSQSSELPQMTTEKETASAVADELKEQLEAEQSPTRRTGSPRRRRESGERDRSGAKRGLRSTGSK